MLGSESSRRHTSDANYIQTPSGSSSTEGAWISASSTCSVIQRSDSALTVTWVTPYLNLNGPFRILFLPGNAS